MKQCIVCKKEFQPSKYVRVQKFCSKKCCEHSWVRNPKRKTWAIIYRNTPKQKEYQRLANSSDKHKASIKAYRQTFQGRFSVLKSMAKFRKISFSLTLEDCKNLWKQNCFYCKMIAMNTKMGYSIDRIDNDKGYVSNNVVPCCSICNRAKSNLSINEFLEWIKMLKARTKPEALRFRGC